MNEKCCEVCGTQLNINKKNVYESVVINHIFHFEEIWNATDCPHCGCQNLLKKRYENITERNKQISNLLESCSCKLKGYEKESEGKDNE